MAWGDADKRADDGAVTWGATDKRPDAKPSVVKDVAKSYFSGLGEGITSLASGMARMTPLGAIVHDSVSNANLARNVVSMVTGSKGPPKIEQPDELPSREMAKVAHKPETMAGDYAHTAGLMTPNALSPGSLPVRMANVVIPALASETAGQVTRAMGGGDTAEAAARLGGGVVGAGAASIRGVPFRPQTPAEILAGRARQDPVRMTQRADDYRGAGINPTAADIVDDSGRGVIRAAASRQTPARGTANDFAATRALDLPSRMSGQARRTMSQDPRTPDDIRATMTRQRSANADTAFGAVRGDTVDLGADALATLRVPDVIDAITAAARRERDPAVRAALDDLGTWAAGDHASGMAPQITIGMADRISRVLLSQARATQDGDLRATLTMFGEQIRGPAREASPGYATALEGYGADSRLQQAAGVGEGLMTRNTDEFVSQAGALGTDERALALAAGRRAIERKSGENPSSAPGVARALADAPEQQARNAALMGPDRARQLQDGMRLEESAVRNARDVAPRTGSGTHLNTSDAERLAGAAKAVGQGLRGDWLGIGIDWLRSRGISDAQAEALVRLATDPARTDEFIQVATARLGAQRAQQFLQLRNASMVGAATALSASPAVAQDQP